MNTTLRKITTAGLGVLLAIALICCSVVVLLGSNKGEAPQQVAEVGTAITTDQELVDWLANQSDDAYLEEDVAFTPTGASTCDITRTLDGNGHTIRIIGGVNQNYQNRTHFGLFVNKLAGTFKDINFVYEGGRSTLQIHRDAIWNNSQIWMGLITAQVSGGGLMENCTLDFDAVFYLNKNAPTSTATQARDTMIFGGLLTGNLNGTIRNCTVNMNSELYMDATGKVLGSGYNDKGYVAVAVGRNDGGQLINTTINVEDGGRLFVDSEAGEFAAGVIAWNANDSSVVDGIIINNAAKFQNKMTAWGGNEFIVSSNYDKGVIKNVYADADINTITHDGKKNALNSTEQCHNAHTYGLASGSSNARGELNVSVFPAGTAYFKAGDANNIYYKDSGLASDKLIWDINGTAVYDSYNFTDKSVNIAKTNVTTKTDVRFGYGDILSGAEVAFSATEMTYAEGTVPTVQLSYDGTVKNITFNYQLDKALTTNSNGYINVGTYTITGVDANIISATEKTIYTNSLIKDSAKTLTVNEKVLTMAINKDNNIYKATVTVTGLAANEALTFSTYAGINFGASTDIPKSYLSATEKLVFEKGSITNANYTIESTVRFDINPLVVGYDSVISVSSGQSFIGDTVIKDDDNRTLTFNDNTVTELKVNAITDVYGLKYTSFSGATTIGTPTSTNGRLEATLAIDGDVEHISVVGSIDTKHIAVATQPGGSASLRYKGVTNSAAKDVTLGDEFTLVATVNVGNVFLGWTNSDGIYVSCNAEHTFYAKNDETYTANFKPTSETSSLTSVKIRNLFGEGVVVFYTASTVDSEIIDYATQNYLDEFNNVAYNTCVGFEVAERSNNTIELRPTYARSTDVFEISFNGEPRQVAMNEKLVLEEGEYLINNVKVNLAEETVIYVVKGLVIIKTTPNYDYPDDLKETSLQGTYDENEYLNFTIISDEAITGPVVLTIVENGIAKYTATIMYTKINDNIIQSIVNLPAEVHAKLSGATVVATVNGKAIDGAIALN